MKEKIQRIRERATFVFPVSASLSPLMCPGKPFSAGEASMWGGLGSAWHCGAARPPPFQEAGMGPLPALQSSLWSLAAQHGCLAFWASCPCPALPASCSAGGSLPRKPSAAAFPHFCQASTPFSHLIVSSPRSSLRDAHEASLGIFSLCCLVASCTLAYVNTCPFYRGYHLS